MPGIYSFVENRVSSVLQDYSAWPANILKLECEKYGIYQDATGAVLAELLSNGDVSKISVEISNSNHPFFTEPGGSKDNVTHEIESALKDLDKFQTNYAYFAELTAFVALCKVHDEIGPHIAGFDVLPKGPRPHLLHTSDGTPDGFAILPGEYLPLEVYNGRDYLGTGGDKHGQLYDFSSDEGIISNPILVNRRSDQEIKKEARSLNGMVIDTDVIIGCEDAVPNLPEILELFNIEELFELLSPLETEGGLKLDGGDYHSIALNGEEGRSLRPPSKMVPAAKQLPEKYIKRIRGGIQLQYVNSYYRQATDRTQREASLVLQNIYNHLLREGGKRRSTAIDAGWDRMIDQYRRIKSAQKRREMILDKTREYITELHSKNVIYERDGKIYARSSEHPQQSLSF
ncbi:hypothetical protein [Halogeometricum luteum]|nr:hypothetical protein [Halogeometricum sp. S3BR5-2]